MSEDNLASRSALPFRSNMIIPKVRTQHRTTFITIINYSIPIDMV
jgi:hypothetical protein